MNPKELGLGAPLVQAVDSFGSVQPLAHQAVLLALSAFDFGAGAAAQLSRNRELTVLARMAKSHGAIFFE